MPVAGAINRLRNFHGQVIILAFEKIFMLVK